MIGQNIKINNFFNLEIVTKKMKISGIFWDFENCPIPKNESLIEMVSELRRKVQEKYGIIQNFSW
jgi:hypothetical protein